MQAAHLFPRFPPAYGVVARLAPGAALGPDSCISGERGVGSDFWQGVGIRDVHKQR